MGNCSSVIDSLKSCNSCADKREIKEEIKINDDLDYLKIPIKKKKKKKLNTIYENIQLNEF